MIDYMKDIRSWMNSTNSLTVRLHSIGNFSNEIIKISPNFKVEAYSTDYTAFF